MTLPLQKRLRKLSQRQLAIYLFAMTMTIAVLLCAAFIAFRYGWLLSIKKHLNYDLALLALNYIEFGAVRRGLIGTIIYLSGFELIYATVALYVISYLGLIVLSFFILRRMIVPTRECLPFLIIIAALILYWFAILGKPDILVAVILVASALALVNGRVALATSFITIGVLVHEESAIFGFPLLAALLIDGARYKRLNRRSLIVSGAIIAAGAIIYVTTMALPHVNNGHIVATITSEHESLHFEDVLVQAALYTALGGVRANRAWMCVIAGWNHLTQLCIALTIVATTVFILGVRRPVKWTTYITGAVPPILFLWMTGADMNRWAALGILNVWIICAIRNYVPVEDNDRRFLTRIACAVAILPVLYPKAYGLQIPVFYSSPLIESAIEMAIGHPAYKSFDDCDPTWRSVLSQTTD